MSYNEDYVDSEYEALSDKELIAKLSDTQFVERFEKSDDWKAVREACKRTKQSALLALVKANAADSAYINKLQRVAEIYGDFVPNLIRSLKQEYSAVTEEAKFRGLLN